MDLSKGTSRHQMITKSMMVQDDCCIMEQLDICGHPVVAEKISFLPDLGMRIDHSMDFLDIVATNFFSMVG